jgi:OmcA/MtrC family decaheme c-type cytochrome
MHRSVALRSPGSLVLALTLAALAGCQGSNNETTPKTTPPPPPLPITLTITAVEHSGPGDTPQVVFTVSESGAPLDILAQPLARLLVTVAGPTTDYASYWQDVIQGAGAAGTLAVEGAAGTYRYTFPVSMAPSATGTYAFALEGYALGSGAGAKLIATNPVFFAAVTDAVPVPRRKVVDGAACAVCHPQLAAHGGIRNDAQYCSLCHNPDLADDLAVARFEVPVTAASPLDLKVLIHKIHMGTGLTQQPYLVGGYPMPTVANPGGTPIDFGQVQVPGDVGNCAMCHAGKTYALPLAAEVQPSLSEVLVCNDLNPDPAVYCTNRVVSQQTYTPPTTAVCTSCHDAPYVVAHAETNTSMGGVEACATCHGQGTAWDVAVVHKVSPR